MQIFDRISYSMWKIGVLIERQRAYGRSICSGISQFARQAGNLSLKMLEWDDLSRPQGLSQFDGFIARILNEKMARRFMRTNKPVVDIFHEREWAGISSVDQHANSVAQLAVRHLIEHKFIRFGFCGFNGRHYSDARRDAFCHCLSLNHFNCQVYDSPSSLLNDFDNLIIRRERMSFNADNATLLHWIKSLTKPVAVFCAHDLRAYQLIELCNQHGIRVPEEIAVLGVDNDELICNFVTPTLSSIDLNGETIGSTAAELIVRHLENPDLKPTFITVRPSKIVERESTSIYPVDPPWLSDALIYIRRNVAQRISADDVFKHLNRSHTLVSNAFRKTLGTSVQKEIQNSRLVEAQRLIRTTTLPLREIATLSGFASLQYFSSSFSTEFGKPPSAFRH